MVKYLEISSVDLANACGHSYCLIFLVVMMVL